MSDEPENKLSEDDLRKLEQALQQQGKLSPEGSTIENVHGRRRVKHYLFSESDIQLIELASIVSSFTTTLSLTALTLWAGAYWDVISVGIENEGAAKMYMTGCLVASVLFAAVSVVSIRYLRSPQKRAKEDTKFNA